MKSAVFLDRDNTLIANDGDLGDPGAVRLLDGVAEGVRALREAGYQLIVITNQGGVARGVFTEADVDAVHQRIATLVDETAGAEGLIDRFYYCPYHPEAKLEEYRREHPWRKPQPGMLLQAARDMHLDLSRSWFIGDQARDVAAGRAAGCRTVLVTDDEAVAESAEPAITVQTFDEAVQTIVQRTPALMAENGTPRAEGKPGSEPDHAEPSRSASGGSETADMGGLRRAIGELTDELRSTRMKRAEFSGVRLAAGLCQLLAVLMALLGLLQLGSTDIFMKWMVGAVLVQLVTITIMLLDQRG